MVLNGCTVNLYTGIWNMQSAGRGVSSTRSQIPSGDVLFKNFFIMGWLSNRRGQDSWIYSLECQPDLVLFHICRPCSLSPLKLRPADPKHSWRKASESQSPKVLPGSGYPLNSVQWLTLIRSFLNIFVYSLAKSFTCNQLELRNQHFKLTYQMCALQWRFAGTNLGRSAMVDVGTRPKYPEVKGVT